MSARFLIALPLLLAACAPAQAPAEEWVWNEEIQYPAMCEDWDDWDKPADPFRVQGNTYYVGTCGIAALAIVTDDGIILIDSGTEIGADVVRRNLTRAGLDVADVRLLLTSHEHHDHVGGMAKLQDLSGARLLTSAAAAPVLRSGQAAVDDPQAAISERLAPVAQVDVLDDSMTVTLGNTTLRAFATPGHTSGALSWSWEDCAEGYCRTIVYADSMSPVSADEYRFSDHPDYLAAYRAGIARFSSATGDDCDILLTPHPSASGMRDKLLADDLTSGMNCRQYAASITQRLNERLAQEAATP